MVRGLSCPFTPHLTGAWDVVQGSKVGEKGKKRGEIRRKLRWILHSARFARRFSFPFSPNARPGPRLI